jgi:hypothetical protein
LRRITPAITLVEARQFPAGQRAPQNASAMLSYKRTHAIENKQGSAGTPRYCAAHQAAVMRAGGLQRAFAQSARLCYDSTEDEGMEGTRLSKNSAPAFVIPSLGSRRFRRVGSMCKVASKKFFSVIASGQQLTVTVCLRSMVSLVSRWGCLTRNQAT